MFFMFFMLFMQAHFSVVPIVYGFPSQPLVDKYRGKEIRMGGDYLIECAGALKCLNCSPHKCCEIKIPDSYSELLGSNFSTVVPDHYGT